MENTNEVITYTRLDKGNLIILVPNEQADFAPVLGNRILWSLKEFEGKVYSEMDENFVLKNILQQRLLRGEAIYDIKISLYEDSWIDERFEAHLKDFWAYYAMKQTYRYYDTIIAQYSGDQQIDGLISHVGWSNNTKDSIGVKALNSHVDFKKGVMFSSYTEYTEELFENYITEFIAKCGKIEDNYSYGAPQERPTFTYPGEIKIEVPNAFFIFKEDNVYCGIASNEDIVSESSWEHYINEVYKNVKDRKLIYDIKVPRPNLRAFTNVNVHAVLPNAIQKTVYSPPLQIIEIIEKCKETLYLKYNNLKKIYFTTKYVKQKKYITIEFLDQNWEKIDEKEIEYEYNIEFYITNHESIITSLSQ